MEGRGAVPSNPDRGTLRTTAVRGHFRGVLALSEAEVDRLVRFARDEPQLGKLIRFPVAPKSRPEAPTTG